MAFVNSCAACEGVKSELDLFTGPVTQKSIESSQWTVYQPLTALDAGGPIEFLIPGSGNDYTDLASLQVFVRFKIVQGDGTDLGAGANVAPVNNFLHSMFSQIDVSLNGTLVTPSTNTYAYRSYIETLLSYGSDAKQSHLTGSLWYKDTAGHMNARGDDNTGFIARRALTADSREVELMGRLHVDAFTLSHLLPCGVDTKVRMVRSKDAFALMAPAAAPGCRIVIRSIGLYVRKVKLNPEVQMAHITAWELGTAKFPMVRVDCKSFSITAGTLSHTHENLYMGVIPKRIILMMVDNAGYNGDYTRNPFDARHNNINFLTLVVDGRQVPSKPLQPDFPRNRCIRSYMNLFEATGKSGEDEGNDISRADFAAGYTVFAFDLTPDCCDGAHFNLVRQGTVGAEMNFETPLPRPMNVVVYAEFETVMEIDRSRNVLYDCTS